MPYNPASDKTHYTWLGFYMGTNFFLNRSFSWLLSILHTYYMCFVCVCKESGKSQIQQYRHKTVLINRKNLRVTWEFKFFSTSCFLLFFFSICIAKPKFNKQKTQGKINFYFYNKHEYIIQRYERIWLCKYEYRRDGIRI